MMTKNLLAAAFAATLLYAGSAMAAEMHDHDMNDTKPTGEALDSSKDALDEAKPEEHPGRALGQHKDDPNFPDRALGHDKDSEEFPGRAFHEKNDLDQASSGTVSQWKHSGDTAHHPHD